MIWLKKDIKIVLRSKLFKQQSERLCMSHATSWQHTFFIKLITMGMVLMRFGRILI